MNKTQEILTREYQKVCQQLGDAYLKQKELEKLIKNLEDLAAALNHAHPLMLNVESQATESLDKDK